MKLFSALILIYMFTFAVLAQKPDDILATAKGHTVRVRDLSPEIQKEIADHPANLLKSRAALFDQMTNELVLGLEAKALGVSSGKLTANETAKASTPTEAQIVAFYAANKGPMERRTIDEVRKPIADYLRRQAEQEKIGALLSRLKTKYKVVVGKNVNAAGLAAKDVLATINGQPVTVREFEDHARIPLFNEKARLADDIINEIDKALDIALLSEEARSLGIDPGTLISREITDKMKEFSDEERLALTDDLAKRLYAKYDVKILYTAPDPILQNISTGNSPATGPANAPVTVVMFSDFQCSACSATHPSLKKAMAAYPGKVRFVVRSFPLEMMHTNAWRAALAAAAANAQGKFFQYVEVLYANQDKLDDASLKKYAVELSLNVKQFELDFNSEKTAAIVRADMSDGKSYGIGSTPTVYVNGMNVRRLSLDAFRKAIDKALEIK